MGNGMLDLRNWGEVLGRLSTIKKNGQLDSHQDELLRMLRYAGNWRLRESALEAVQQIQSPAASLVAEILKVVLDDNLYCEVRVLACNTLKRLIEGSSTEKIGDLAPAAIEGHLRAIAAVPQPPMLADALVGCLQRLESFGRGQLSPAAR